MRKGASMARVSTYLNFKRDTEAAFNFYKSVFGTEFVGEISRMGEAPPDPSRPPLPEEDKNLVMNVMLPILDGHILMGTDMPDSVNYKLVQGNNVYINLEPDTRDETETLFEALAVGGKVELQLQDMFWGGYYGSLKDKFGVQWMFNCASKT